MSVRPLTVLLAEDDPGHAHLVQKNLRRAGVTNEIVHVGDGQLALDYIRRVDQFARRPGGRPILLILDINMPRVDGIEVLSELKSSDVTSTVPVIMLTTTDDPREIQTCYELGCSAYITKPVDYAAFADAVGRIGMFLQVVQFPPESFASN